MKHICPNSSSHNFE